MQKQTISLAICVILAITITGYFILVPPVMAVGISPRSNQVSIDHVWSLTFGTESGTNVFNSIAACQSGGYVAIGIREYHAFLVRINPQGHIVWQRIYDNIGVNPVVNEVIECQSGGFAIIGYVMSNHRDAILIRTDENGLITWYQTYGHSDTIEEGAALVECGNGGFAFVGRKNDLDYSSSDCWLARIDAQGNHLWNCTYGGLYYEDCHSLIETQSEAFLLAGSTYSFGSGNQDALLLKTTSMGQVVWNTTFGGMWDDACYDVIETRTGLYAIVGETHNSSNVVSDAFVTTFASNGTLLWSNIFGGVSEDIGYALTECSDGGFGITGRTIEWEGHVRFANLFVARINVGGEFLWTKSYGGQEDDWGNSILLEVNGDFVVAGSTTSFSNSYSKGWVLRIPDAIPSSENLREYGPVNLLLIGAGAGLSILMVLGSYLLLHRSQKELTVSWSTSSQRSVRKTFLSPRVINELSSVLTGLTQCPKCETTTMKAEENCQKCSFPLHRCIFCDTPIQETDSVVFCPSCIAIAHYQHMMDWIKKRNFCPRCGLRFPTPSSSF